MSSSNGRRPSPAITLEEAERELAAAINELPGVDLLLWLRIAVVDQDGQQSMHARGSLQGELAPLAPAIRLSTATAMRELADRVEADLDLVGEPYRCPACGDRQRIPQAELADDRIAGRYCEGRIRPHPPAMLLPDHPTRSTL